jgi:hypothetical protein
MMKERWTTQPNRHVLYNKGDGWVGGGGGRGKDTPCLYLNDPPPPPLLTKRNEQKLPFPSPMGDE